MSEAGLLGVCNATYLSPLGVNLVLIKAGASCTKEGVDSTKSSTREVLVGPGPQGKSRRRQSVECLHVESVHLL
jgi:hypothetical protein